MKRLVGLVVGLVLFMPTPALAQDWSTPWGMWGDAYWNVSLPFTNARGIYPPDNPPLIYEDWFPCGNPDNYGCAYRDWGKPGGPWTIIVDRNLVSDAMWDRSNTQALFCTILTHELWHTAGIPHQPTGLMRYNISGYISEWPWDCKVWANNR